MGYLHCAVFRLTIPSSDTLSILRFSFLTHHGMLVIKLILIASDKPLGGTDPALSGDNDLPNIIPDTTLLNRNLLYNIFYPILVYYYAVTSYVI